MVATNPIGLVREDIQNVRALGRGIANGVREFANMPYNEKIDAVAKGGLGLLAGGAGSLAVKGGVGVAASMTSRVGRVGAAGELAVANSEAATVAREAEVRNGYSYLRDEAGRVELVDANLVRNPVQGRNASAQLNAGGEYRLADDQGGHYIGRRFNGPLDDFNHFAQNGNFNMGAYRTLENSWDAALQQNLPVRVQLRPSYVGDSLRPDTLHVRYWIDNIPNEKFFYNRPGGR